MRSLIPKPKWFVTTLRIEAVMARGIRHVGRIATRSIGRTLDNLLSEEKLTISRMASSLSERYRI
jgi:hypothetical protein